MINRNPDGTFASKPLGYRKKTCTKCGQYLYLRDFYHFGRSKNHPDGYDCRCKQCRRKEKNDEYARNRKVPDGLRMNAEGRVVEKKGASSRLYWPPMKVQDFKREFPYNTNEDLAIDFECSVRTIVRRARELGLEKDPEWLTHKWNKNRRMAHFMNKLESTPKADLTNFLEAGKQHRFQPGHEPHGTPEERSERMKRAWQTRRRNKILNHVSASATP